MSKRKKLTYLDHAATSYPKPESVLRAMLHCMRAAGGNPGRGSHRLAALAAEEIYRCREVAGELFDTLPERVVCTSGATMGLNLALHGFLKKGDHVLLDSLAHNAAYRPLYALAEAGTITMTLYDAHGSTTDTLASLAEHTRPETRLVVATHMSNICSIVEPIAAIGQYCREHGLFFVVDGAQSGGHLPLSVRKMGITALSLPGHKGLLGPQGCGLLLFGADAPMPVPLLWGGSGTHSLDPTMPTMLPERLEAGTLPTPAIAGLRAGLELVQRTTVAALHETTMALGKQFVQECTRIPGLRMFNDTPGAVLSFGIEGIEPSHIAAHLNEHGICVRSGYHCAPIAHRTIGSFETGSVRVSFGYDNTKKDVWHLLSVLDECRKTR